MDIDKKIREICHKVYNQLGYGGLSEACYQRALEIELQNEDWCCIREYYINQHYKDGKGRNHCVACLRVDILITDIDTILELKCINKITDKERAQIKRYKYLSKCSHSYLINFGKQLEIEYY